MSSQNNMERLKDLMKRGIITADEANIRMVRNERIRVVSKLTREVRNALYAAVKAGRLCRMKKDGRKPEVFYHPNFRHLAVEARNQAEKQQINALLKICV